MKNIKVTCVAETPFYDSDWKIEGTLDNGEEFSVQITRLDTETPENLLALVEKCSTIDDIKGLDRKGTIWYD